MKRITLACLLTAVCLPATAQNWNDAERGLVMHIQGCWDGWVQAVNAADVGLFEEACPLGDYAYWVTADGMPGDLNSLRRNWGESASNIKQMYWEDLRPVSIKISGDVAVIHYYSYWYWEDEDPGDMREAKRMETWQMQDGRWTLIGGMLVPSG